MESCFEIIVIKSFRWSIDIDRIGVNEKHKDVNCVNQESSQVEKVTVLVPLELNQIFESIGLEDWELFRVSTFFK